MCDVGGWCSLRDGALHCRQLDAGHGEAEAPLHVKHGAVRQPRHGLRARMSREGGLEPVVNKGHQKTTTGRYTAAVRAKARSEGAAWAGRQASQVPSLRKTPYPKVVVHVYRHPNVITQHYVGRTVDESPLAFVHSI